MIISINTENAYNSAPIYDKTSQSIRNTGLSFSLIKGTCQKSAGNIIINGEILKVVPLRWGQGKDSQPQGF